MYGETNNTYYASFQARSFDVISSLAIDGAYSAKRIKKAAKEGDYEKVSKCLSVVSGKLERIKMQRELCYK